MTTELLGLVIEADDIGGALVALLRDAAATWKQIDPWLGAGAMRWAMRAFVYAPHDCDRFSDRVVDALEHPESLGVNLASLAGVANVKTVPSPDAVRRMRIVTGELPQLLRPIANRGAGSNVETLWRLLWFIPMGFKAPSIGKSLGIGRPQVWRLHGRAIAQLADAVTALLRQERAAA